MTDENTGTAAPTEAAPAQAAPEAVQDDNTEDMGEDLEQSGSEAQATSKDQKLAPKEEKKQEAEIKKALREFELKVNGKSKKVSIDMDNDEEVKKYLQKAMASDEKFQEASTYKKQAEQLVEMLQKDPLSILRNPALGLDIKKLAEQVLLQDLEEQQLSPEQKKIKEYEEKLKSYDDEKKKQSQESDRMRLEEATRKNYEEVENSMLTALESADFPPEPFFVRRVADIWASAVESGWEDAKLEDIMPYVQNRLQDDFKSLIGKHKDPDKLEKLIGKDILDGYRKSKVAKMKKIPVSAQKMAEATVKPVEQKKPDGNTKRIRFSDF